MEKTENIAKPTESANNAASDTKKRPKARRHRTHTGGNGIYAKGYDEAGASLTRRALQGFIPSSGSPNEDIIRHASTLRQRSRMLMMSSPIATSIIDTYRTKVVGPGLSLKSTINREILGLSAEEAKIWEKKVEAEWNLWSSKKQNCDALGLNDFYSIQQLAIKSWLASGDCTILFKRDKESPFNPYTLRLHVIEADRIRTPEKYRGGIASIYNLSGKIPDGEEGAGNTVHDGVEVDANGKVIAFHICNVYPGEMSGEFPEYTRVKAIGEKTGMPNVLFSLVSERPEQYRGVPILAPSIESLIQVRRYTESELMSSIVQSMFTAWIETEADPAEIIYNETGSEYDEDPDNGDIDENPNTYEMSPGTVINLKKGEKIVFGNPNIPTAGFEAFMRTHGELICAGAGFPYEVVMKKYNASYSAARGELLEAWETVKMWRSWLINGVCQPTYEMFLAEAVATGRIKAPGFFDDPLIRSAWCGAKWIGPVQGSIDPKKEIDANIKAVEHGFKTHTQVTREGGGDWDTNIEMLTDENKRLQKAREAFSKNTGGNGT